MTHSFPTRRSSDLLGRAIAFQRSGYSPSKPEGRRSKKARGSVSRVLSTLLRGIGGHSSRPHIAARLKQPTRAVWAEIAWGLLPAPPLFGLADRKSTRLNSSH